MVTTNSLAHDLIPEQLAGDPELARFQADARTVLACIQAKRIQEGGYGAFGVYVALHVALARSRLVAVD